MPLSLNKCSRPAPRTLGQQKKRLQAAETRPRGTGPDSNASKQTNRFLPGAAPGLRGAASRRLPEWTRIAASQNHLEWASQAADRQRQYHLPLILGRRGPRSSPVPPSCPRTTSTAFRLQFRLSVPFVNFGSFLFFFFFFFGRGTGRDLIKTTLGPRFLLSSRSPMHANTPSAPGDLGLTPAHI